MNSASSARSLASSWKPILALARSQDRGLLRAAARSANRTLIGLLISLVALCAVGWWGLHQRTPSFPASGPELALLATACALYGIATLARGVRWHVILSRAGIGHARSDALGLTAVGYMGNTVLPARGGEVLRILLLGERSQSPRKEILGSIVAERLLDALGLGALFVLMTWAGVAGRPTGQVPAALTVGAVAAAAVGLVGYSRLRNRGQLERFATLIRPFVRASRLLYGRLGLGLLFLTVGVWLVEGVIFWLAARSLDVHIHAVDGLFLVVLTSFFSLLPAAPGYIGTFDAALLFGLAALDVKGSEALSLVLLVRFILFVPITAAGAALMFARYGGLLRLRSVSTDRSAPGTSDAS